MLSAQLIHPARTCHSLSLNFPSFSDPGTGGRIQRLSSAMSLFFASSGRVIVIAFGSTSKPMMVKGEPNTCFFSLWGIPNSSQSRRRSGLLRLYCLYESALAHKRRPEPLHLSDRTRKLNPGLTAWKDHRGATLSLPYQVQKMFSFSKNLSIAKRAAEMKTRWTSTSPRI